MAGLKSKKKLAAVVSWERPGNNFSRDTNVPRVIENYITQVSKEIEGRVTRKVSEEVSRTESHILGDLSKLDKFLLKTQFCVPCRTASKILRICDRENQEYNEDCSQNDPHPKVGTSVNSSSHSMNLDTDLVHRCISLLSKLCVFQKLIELKISLLLCRLQEIMRNGRTVQN